MVKTVEQYLNSLPKDRQGSVKHLHEVLVKAVPQLKPKLWDYSGGMIGYGTYRYKSKSGREGDWCVLGLANRKNFISLYTMGYKDGKYLAEVYHPRMPGTKIGKSCINIFKPEQLDDAVVIELAQETATLFPQAK